MTKIRIKSDLCYPNFLRKTKRERLINAFAISALAVAWILLLCAICLS